MSDTMIVAALTERLIGVKVVITSLNGIIRAEQCNHIFHNHGFISGLLTDVYIMYHHFLEYSYDFVFNTDYSNFTLDTPTER